MYFATSCEPSVAFEKLLPVFTQRIWALLLWRDALFCNTKFTKLSKIPVTCWKQFQHEQRTFESAVWLWMYFSSHRGFWSMYGNYIRHPWVSKDMNFFAIRHDTRWAFQANFRQRMGLWWRERERERERETYTRRKISKYWDGIVVWNKYQYNDSVWKPTSCINTTSTIKKSLPWGEWRVYCCKYTEQILSKERERARHLKILQERK